MLLQIKHISVSAGSNRILNDINLEIKPGDVMIMFGPNGSGKSTLLKALMGFGGYSVDAGHILFKGKELNTLPTEERVRLGMGMMYQHPPKITGLKLRQIAELLSPDHEKIAAFAKQLHLEAHLQRDINVGYSGGEMKRSELFQLILQNPDLILLDEPESGVDVENISLMGKILKEFLSDGKKAALIITHTGYILDYIEAEKGCVMMEGNFWCVGNPKSIFRTIREEGYEKCKECACPTTGSPCD